MYFATDFQNSDYLFNEKRTLKVYGGNKMKQSKQDFMKRLNLFVYKLLNSALSPFKNADSEGKYRHIFRNTESRKTM